MKREPKQTKQAPNQNKTTKTTHTQMADPHIEFTSRPNFSEWSIFLGNMISSRLLSRKWGVRNQKSYYREKLLLQVFFQDDLCSWVLRFISVQSANESFCSFFQHTVSTEKTDTLFHLALSATVPSQSVWCQTTYSWLLFIFVQDAAVSSHPAFKSIMTNSCFLKCLLNTVERLFSALAQWDFSLEPETLWSLGAYKAWAALQNLGSLPKALSFFFKLWTVVEG